jgi:PadR family transcriptional regulator, regulatory protein AphA
MSLDHAILGFIHESPRSGYDLKKAFDGSVAHFWPASQSQIYRTLERLTGAGMVEVQVIQQDGKPNRKVYHLTEGGQAELHEWLVAPLPLNDMREAFLIQFFWADAITQDELVKLLEDRAIKHKERLEFYVEALRKFEDKPPVGVWDKVLQPLIVDAGIGLEKAWLSWIEQALEKIGSVSPIDGVE